jgi:hypothetical protein
LQAVVLLSLVGAVMFLPRLSGEPLWDPDELVLADAARGTGAEPVPRILQAIVALSVRLFGGGEFARRAPFALVATLALIACYYAGAALLPRRRAALLGALAFAVTPALALSGRHVDAFALRSLAAALFAGGVGRLAALRKDRGLVPDVHALAAAGGLLLGVALDGPAFAGAALGALALWAASDRRWCALACGLAVAVLVIVGERREPHLLAAELRQVGLRLFPWVLVAPWLVGDALVGDGDRRGASFLLLWLVASFLSVPFVNGIARAGLPAASFALFALAGDWLDRVGVGDGERPQPLLALALLLGSIVLAHDATSTPGLLFSPAFAGDADLQWPERPLALVALTGVGTAACLAATVMLPSRLARARRALVVGAFVVALAGTQMFGLQVAPAVAEQHSLRGLYRAARVVDATRPFVHYDCSARGAPYDWPGPSVSVNSVAELAAHMSGSGRVFAAVPAAAMPLVDEAIRARHARYVQLEAPPQRCILLSNQSRRGEATRPPPFPEIDEHAPHPMFTADAEWDHAIELVGYDLPREFSRRQPFELRLYFHVKAPLAEQNKLAVHLDGPRERIYANHYPLRGRYPLDHWPPGYYVVDSKTIDYRFHDDMNELVGAPGEYKVYIAFFGGKHDVALTRGHMEADGRLYLTTIRLRE